ncbi:MAG TPA: hemerythrin domain-containing protein [Micromonosporaceae bacterium]
MTKAEQRDVIDLLLEQHDQIKALFAEVAAARGPEKQELFEDLVRLLAVHETAEEEVVHPTARRRLDDGDEIIEMRLQEEEEAKQLLADLYDLGVDEPSFDARLQLLAESVIEHAALEETEEFDALREILDSKELARMAGAVQAAEAVAPTRPHPGLGESATANVLTGPPLAIFDRVADAVRDWRSKGDQQR